MNLKSNNQMKTILLFFALCFYNSSYLYSQIIIDTIKIAPEKVDTNYFQKGGLYNLNLNVANGKWRTYYTNGQLFAEYLVNNHQLNGTVVYYWANGNVFMIEKNIDDKIDGIKYRFHPNGEIASITNWDKGKRIGKWRYYDFKGKLHRTVKADDPSLGPTSFPLK